MEINGRFVCWARMFCDLAHGRIEKKKKAPADWNFRRGSLPYRLSKLISGAELSILPRDVNF